MSTRSARYSSVELGLPKFRTARTDRDAAAFLEAAGIVAGYQQRAIYELVRLLKQYGIWSSMNAIYPFVGGTATTHKWNLKDPRDLDAAHRLTFSGGWTHNAAGITPNGSNTYANTYYNTAIGPTLSGNMAVYSKTDRITPAGIEAEMGAFKSLPNSYTDLKAGALISGNYRHGGRFNNIGGGTLGTVGANTLGLYQVTRTSNVNMFFRKDTNLLVTDTDGASYTSATNIFIGAVNNWGTGTTDTPTNYSYRGMAYVSLGQGGLSASQCNAHYHAVQRYQQLLGRAV